MMIRRCKHILSTNPPTLSTPLSDIGCERLQLGPQTDVNLSAKPGHGGVSLDVQRCRQHDDGSLHDDAHGPESLGQVSTGPRVSGLAHAVHQSEETDTERCTDVVGEVQSGLYGFAESCGTDGAGNTHNLSLNARLHNTRSQSSCTNRAVDCFICCCCCH